MKRTTLSLALALLCGSGFSQDKLLTLEDAMVRNRSSLAPQNLRGLQFLYGTNDYVYLKRSGAADMWVRGSAGSTETQPLLTLEALNGYLRRSGQDTAAGMPPVQFNKGKNWILDLNGRRLSIDPQTGKMVTLIDTLAASREIVEESGSGYVAYVDKFNLFVTNGRTTRQLTRDGSSNIVYGASVHRDEFGISKGTFWSPSGKSLAFYRMDQSMVADYPLIDWKSVPAKVVNIKYPMAGGKSHHVTVGVYNTATGKTVYLRTGQPADQYLTNIAWSPDERHLYMAIVNRGQDTMKLNQYDAATGAFVRTLFTETDAKYVEPLVPMLFMKGNPGQFIWQSSRDGWNHLYLYGTDGRMIRQLTRGAWEVLEVKGFDESSRYLLYTSTEESPISKNLYRLELATGQTQRITQGHAVHTVQVNTSGSWVLDSRSDPGHPRQIGLIEVATGRTTTLLDAPDPLAGYARGTMQVFTIPNAEGTPLYSRLYKPVNFDSTKKYPVVVYWYGGPHAQLVTAGYNGGAGDYWFQYLAERGYLVFTLDPRGSDNRGRAFEQAIFRTAGDPQMEDLMSGVRYLQSLSYADKDRMGLFGWSYGGFMTIDFMLHHPGVFKAAIAGGPVTDWSLYEIMYGERYMDRPQENPGGYVATDLSRMIDRLVGRLLLIHGTQDPVVVQQHSVKLVRAAIDKGVQVDYMIYPGHEHNVLGADRAHLYGKVTDYLEQHLKKEQL